MPHITAITDTWLKLTPIQAKELPDSAKVSIKKGQQLAYLITKTVGIHFELELASALREYTRWYAFNRDFRLETALQYSSDCIELIKEFESLELKAYYCPAGVLTIGYGHTGADVYEGLAISQSQAVQLLTEDMDLFTTHTLRVVKVPLLQNQLDALISFTFNTGITALSTSTLLRKLNAGDTQSAAMEFERWVKGDGGVVLPGLVRRRKAEKCMFLGQDWRVFASAMA
jgi:lysozyme